MDLVTDPDVGRPSAKEASGLPYARSRDRNTPWIVFGILLTALGGLGAFLVATSLADRVDVVVATRDISAGDPLTAGDLTVVAISGGNGARAIAGSRIPRLVGSVSRTDVRKGAILHPDQLVAADEVIERNVIIGVALAPGEYPLAAMAPNQVVQVIEVSGETSLGNDADGSAVLGRATIVAVHPLASTDDLLVSMRTGESLGPRVSERAQQRRIRLVLVENPDPTPAAATTTATTRASVPNASTTAPAAPSESVPQAAPGAPTAPTPAAPRAVGAAAP